MNILSKLMTAMRGGMNELGEATMETQAMRILDQEVRDAGEELKKSKDSLAEMMARQKVAEKQAADVAQQIETHEGYAIQALEKEDEPLALEVAAKVAALESRYADLTNSAKQYEASCDSLRDAIHQTEQSLNMMKQQIDTVKANENVQRAQEAVSARHSGSDSKLRTAMDSLEQIKEKQALKSAKMEAADEIAAVMGTSSLDAKLAAAGITTGKSNAADVLARIKSKKSG